MSARPGNTEREDRTIARAIGILERRFAQSSAPYRICSDHDLRTWARLKLADLDRETFVVAFLDMGHKVIAVEHLALGTLNASHVYPREVARAALRHNAAAVVLVHNHPSGRAEFSEADKELTEHLRRTCRLIDVSVLDHLLIAGAESVTYESMLILERDRRIEEKRARQSQIMKAAWARRKARS